MLNSNKGALLRSILRCTPVLISFTVVLYAIAAPTQVKKQKTNKSKLQKQDRPKGHAFKLFINEGDSTETDAYYASLAQTLKFPGNVPPKNLDALISYFGYGGLQAIELENLNSNVLMDFGVLRTVVKDSVLFESNFGTRPIAPNELLASRFFAPKITDVSATPDARGNPRPLQLGWRKLVYLMARPGSLAEAAGVSEVYLLFNHFWLEADQAARKSPFTQHSVNTQAIIVSSSKKVSFLVFEPLNDDGSAGNLGKFLNATFDAREPKLGDPVRKYFVPAACIQCHGDDDDAKGKLNYLDTDHWYDRVQNDDDFSIVKTLPVAVLFDADKTAVDGGTSTQSNYAGAFDVLRKLNTKVEEQNRVVDSGSFPHRAAEKWLTNHSTSDAFSPQLDRALDPVQVGGPKWTTGDEAILKDLNRFCFRCHSSVRFQVFDKEAVKPLVNSMKRRINSTNIKFLMPQDRLLTPTEKARLLAELATLAGQP